MNEQETQQALAENSHLPKGIKGRNPVFAKELRGLIRQERSRSVLTFYIATLAAITFLLYVTIVSANEVNPDPDIRRTLGKMIFLAIILAQLVAIIFIVPLFSADSITSERENKTFDLLRITPLSPVSIIRGKLLATIMFTLLLLLISLPLQSIAFLLGGLAPLEFLVSIVLLVATAIFLCSVSIWASTRTKHTSSAMGLVYIIASACLLGFPILAYVVIRLAPISSDQGFFIALQSVSKNLSPVLQTTFIVIVWLLVFSNPIAAAFVSYNLFQDEGVHFLYDLTAFKIHIPLLAPWTALVFLYLLISWLFYRFAVKNVKQGNILL